MVCTSYECCSKRTIHRRRPSASSNRRCFTRTFIHRAPFAYRFSTRTRTGDRRSRSSSFFSAFKNSSTSPTSRTPLKPKPTQLSCKIQFLDLFNLISLFTDLIKCYFYRQNRTEYERRVREQSIRFSSVEVKD